jgi:hypothetical protein
VSKECWSGLDGSIRAGYGAAFALDRFELIKVPLDIYQVSHVPFRVLARDFMVVIGCAVVVCFVAMIYPSRQAARLDPALALRYETTHRVSPLFCRVSLDLSPRIFKLHSTGRLTIAFGRRVVVVGDRLLRFGSRRWPMRSVTFRIKIHEYDAGVRTRSIRRATDKNARRARAPPGTTAGSWAWNSIVRQNTSWRVKTRHLFFARMSM